jgi:hypothetical protein
MSIRSEAPVAAQLVPNPSGMTTVRTEAAADALATINAAQNIDPALAEANDFSTNNVSSTKRHAHYTPLATQPTLTRVHSEWQPEHPLKRSVVVSVRASLEDLCLRKAKATWAPSAEAVGAILKQAKFVDLAGTSEKVRHPCPTHARLLRIDCAHQRIALHPQQGDLKSVVVHKISMRNCKNT